MQLTYSTFLRYFTVLLVSASAAYILYNKFFINLKTGDEVTADETVTKALFDGSMVTLEKGTYLKIKDLDETRTVTLSGRANFKVDEDTDKIFTVETESSVIRTRGGTFMVNTLIDNGTEVFVESGEIDFSQNPKAFKGSSMMVGVLKGESAELTAGKRGIRKRKIKDQNYLAWQTGSLTFNNINMTEVGGILENTTQMKVIFSSPSLRLCRLSGEFTFDSPEDLFSKISETLNISYTISAGTVTFTGDACK